MNTKTVTLDVREDLHNGREPFSRIMATVAGLQPDERLLLIAPFKPVPLFHVMAVRGFVHEEKAIAAGDWEVLFTRRHEADVAQTGPAPPIRKGHCADSAAPAAVVDVDARGLEPPQPMVKILETLGSLPAGATLRARTDRRPMHLYLQLAERGFTGKSEEQTDGSFITHIRSA